MQGIPSNLSLEQVQSWVAPRISGKRFSHTEGVVKVAKELARKYDCDEYLAELGGWLHDACKENKPKALVEQARAFNMELGPIEISQGHLLHGPVAAELVRTELGITHKDLLAAIAEHTLGNVPMSKLSEVLFLADCLEDSRPKDYTAPIWSALDFDGSLNVAKAMLTASNLGLMHLLESGRPIHPRTIEVRNHYLELLKNQAEDAEKN